MVLHTDLAHAMLILIPKNEGDRLGDFLRRLPGEKRIRIGCRAGYIYEGTAGSYWQDRGRIIRELLTHNRRGFQRAIQSYVRECKKKSKQDVQRRKYALLMEKYDYIVDFTPLDYRKVAEAYPLPTDPDILVFIIEGEEYSAGDTNEARKTNQELGGPDYDTEE